MEHLYSNSSYWPYRENLTLHTSVYLPDTMPETPGKYYTGYWGEGDDGSALAPERRTEELAPLWFSLRGKRTAVVEEGYARFALPLPLTYLLGHVLLFHKVLFGVFYSLCM